MSKKNKQRPQPQLAHPPAMPSANQSRPVSAGQSPGQAPLSPPGQPTMRPAAPLSAQPAQAPRSDSSPATLEQQRAAHALASVRSVEEAPFRREYRSYVEALPATIVMNGLGQAYATLLSAANGTGAREHAYRQLHSHLEDWLCRNDGGVYCSKKPLIDAIISHGQAEYVHAQSEALAYLVWLKKFSQAFLPRGDRD